MQAVADSVGASHAFISHRTLGGRIRTATHTFEKLEAIHKRLFAALALSELASEVPLAQVAKTFQVPRGSLQSLQSMAATYCGMVRQLCEKLRWHEMAALFESLIPRLCFGVNAEAQPLCRIPGAFPARARALFEAGFTSAESIARAAPAAIEEILRRTHQFESTCSDGQTAAVQEQVVRAAARKIVQGAQNLVTLQVQAIEDEVAEALTVPQGAAPVTAAGPGFAAA
eukprot:TRINITY_DN34237_c0_g1_i1.p2 TRINITY_DN34237_c0_g1~~TRINITY_DN34237_c0_g1_i1.p2  ORF type:complete len:228 (+),score=53.18 TRINITY_DN34237_c0_g1_i1:532-1215(+)